MNSPEDEICRALEVDHSGETSCGLLKRPLHYIRPEWIAEDRDGSVTKMLIEQIRKCLPLGQGCGMED
jgi:hypothetical protein